MLSCYSAVHQDPRIGRVEAATSRAEASNLLRDFRPDVVVVDSSAGDGPGLASAVEQLKLRPSTIILVTFRDGERHKVMAEARALGATGAFARDAFTSELILKALRLPAHRVPADLVAPAGGQPGPGAAQPTTDDATAAHAAHTAAQAAISAARLRSARSA